MPNTGTIKTVLLDDDVQNCLVIEDLLKDYKKINFLGFRTEQYAFQQLVLESSPDVALVDIALEKKTDGIEVLRWLHKDHPQMKVVMITAHAEHIRECYRLGARGYVMKGRWSDLPPTIAKVFRGEMVVPPGTAPLLIEQVAHLETDFTRRVEKSRLSKKETQILDQLLAGKKSRELSEGLGISYFTLKRHLQSMRQKAGVKSTAKLVDKYRSS